MSIKRFCDGCEKQVSGTGDYASVDFDGERRDLCFEKCYAKYEGALQDLETLAVRTEAELMKARREILAKLRQSITEEHDGSPKITANNWTKSPF